MCFRYEANVAGIARSLSLSLVFPLCPLFVAFPLFLSFLFFSRFSFSSCHVSFSFSCTHLSLSLNPFPVCLCPILCLLFHLVPFAIAHLVLSFFPVSFVRSDLPACCCPSLIVAFYLLLFLHVAGHLSLSPFIYCCSPFALWNSFVIDFQGRQRE